MAAALHLARTRLGFRRQARNALASRCARVGRFARGGAVGLARLPLPEGDMLASGLGSDCSVKEPPLQVSPEVQVLTGVVAGGAVHGESEHSWAS